MKVPRKRGECTQNIAPTRSSAASRKKKTQREAFVKHAVRRETTRFDQKEKSAQALAERGLGDALPGSVEPCLPASAKSSTSCLRGRGDRRHRKDARTKVMAVGKDAIETGHVKSWRWNQGAEARKPGRGRWRRRSNAASQ